MIDGWIAKRRLRKQIANCDFEMAKTILTKNFAGKVIPNDLASILDSFTANPCLETALQLLAYDHNFISVFELARKGGFTQHLFRSGDIK